MPDDKKTIEQLEARLRNVKARKSKNDRKDLTRRKIIFGHAVLAHLETLTADKRETLLNGLHKYVTRPTDRRFLGLSD